MLVNKNWNKDVSTKTQEKTYSVKCEDFFGCQLQPAFISDPLPVADPSKQKVGIKKFLFTFYFGTYDWTLDYIVTKTYWSYFSLQEVWPSIIVLRLN